VVDGRVSRRHAALRRLDDGWVVEDLGSTNGITVNGEQVGGAALAEGDTVGLGPLRLRFHEGEPATRGETVMDRAAVADLLAGRPPAPVASAALEESQRRLRLLLELATALDALAEPEALLARFGAVLVQLFRPSFAFVEADGERWAHDGGGGESGLSAGVLERVRQRGEALLLRDVTEEAGLDNIHSASLLGIHTVIGVPVIVGKRQIGSIYVDRRGVAEPPFAEEDLFLVVAIGRLVSAAMAGAVRYARMDARERLQRPTRNGARTGLVPAEAVPPIETVRSRVARLPVASQRGGNRAAPPVPISDLAPARAGPRGVR
jgi:GAF domain-containing protein